MIIGGCVVSEKIEESVNSHRFTFEQKSLHYSSSCGGYILNMCDPIVYTNL